MQEDEVMQELCKKFTEVVGIRLVFSIAIMDYLFAIGICSFISTTHIYGGSSLMLADVSHTNSNQRTYTARQGHHQHPPSIHDEKNNKKRQSNKKQYVFYWENV